MVATAARDAGYRSSGPRQPEIHLARQVEHDVRRRSQRRWRHARPCAEGAAVPAARGPALPRGEGAMRIPPALRRETVAVRSEEHTSELQSRENLVCRLLLETKK